MTKIYVEIIWVWNDIDFDIMTSYVMKLWRNFERHVFSTFWLTDVSIPYQA
jgi:hypothetical protein